MPAVRTFSAGRTALELDQTVTWLASATGGNAFADVIAEPPTADHVVHKHVGQPRYEEIVLECGAANGQPLLDWIAATLSRKYLRKNGAVITADYDGKELRRLDFMDAVLSEIRFPALDASSKDAAKLTVKLSPELTRNKRGGGARINLGAGDPKQKRWLAANFKLDIAGLDCTRVVAVDSIAIKQPVMAESPGSLRDRQVATGELQIPDLVITLPEVATETWDTWFHRFVVEGNSTPADEKTGTLQFLTPDLKDVLFTLGFYGLGIYRLRRLETGGAEAVPRVEASLYCEQIQFAVGPAKMPAPVKRVAVT